MPNIKDVNGLHINGIPVVDKDGTLTHPNFTSLQADFANLVIDIESSAFSSYQDAIDYVHSLGGGTIFVSKSLEVSSLVFYEDISLKFSPLGMLKPTGNINLGGCQIESGLWQIFDYSANGTVTGTCNNPDIYTEWFGAKGDGIVDDTQAFTKAFIVSSCISLIYKKKYLFAGIINCEMNRGITVKGNGAYLINPQFRVAINNNTWRYPFGGSLSYFKDLTFIPTKDDSWSHTSDVSFKPIIVSGAPCVLENICSINMLTLVCYPDVYIDKLIMRNVVLTKNDAILGEATLNCFCRLLSDGTYANEGTENVSAGDGFLFEACQEFYVTNSDYKMIKTESMQPVVFVNCIQCAVEVGRYSIAKFNGCHFEATFATSTASSGGSTMLFDGCFFWASALRKQIARAVYRSCQLRYDLYENISSSAIFEDNNTFTGTFATFQNCQAYYNEVDSFPNYWNDNYNTNTWLNEYISASKETVYDTVNGQAFAAGTYEVTVYLTPKRGYSKTAQYKYTFTYTLSQPSFIGFKLNNAAGFWMKAYIKSPDNTTIYYYSYQLPPDFNGISVFSCSRLLSRVNLTNMVSVRPIGASQILAATLVASVPDIPVNTNIVCVNNTITQTYTLTYIAGTNGTITGTLAQTVIRGYSGTQVTATPNSGYKFVSWSDGVTTASRTDANVQTNISVTATFATI